MKTRGKVLAIVLAVAIGAAVAGCEDGTGSSSDNQATTSNTADTAKESSSWEKEDFSFYDQSNHEVIFTTKDNKSISMLSEKDDNDEILQTYRGVRLGDKASGLVDIYDFSKFHWGYTFGSSASESLKQLGDTLEKKYSDPVSALKHADEVTGNNKEIILEGYFLLKNDGTVEQYEYDSNGDPKTPFPEEPDITSDASQSNDAMRNYSIQYSKAVKDYDASYTLIFFINNEKVEDIRVDYEPLEPTVNINDGKSIENTLPLNSNVSLGMTRADVESKVGKLVDRTSEIGFTGGTDQSQNVNLNGTSVFVTYYFDEKGKLSGVRYVAPYSDTAYQLLKDKVSDILGDPISSDQFNEGKDEPYWNVQSGNNIYSANAHIDEGSNKIILFYGFE